MVNILDYLEIQYIYELLKTEHYKQQLNKEENYGTSMGRENPTDKPGNFTESSCWHHKHTGTSMNSFTSRV